MRRRIQFHEEINQVNWYIYSIVCHFAHDLTTFQDIILHTEKKYDRTLKYFQISTNQHLLRMLYPFDIIVLKTYLFNFII